MNEPVFSTLDDGKGSSITVSGAGLTNANGTYSLNGTFNGYNNYVNDNNSSYRIRVASGFISGVGFQENWNIVQTDDVNYAYTRYAIPRGSTTTPPSSGWYVMPQGSSPAPTLS